MQSLRLAIVFVAAAFVFAALPSLAQDEGKEKASELASSSQKALSQLQAKVQLAKLLTPKAHAILVFPKVTKAGLMIGGQYGRRGYGEDHDDKYHEGRHLRVRLRTKGTDGRPWHPGKQDLEDHAEVSDRGRDEFQELPTLFALVKLLSTPSRGWLTA